VVPSRGDDGLDAQPGQAGAQGIAVIPSIGGQSLGPLARASWPPGAADGDGLEGRRIQRNSSPMGVPGLVRARCGVSPIILQPSALLMPLTTS
jgi:hypothetical protein